MTSSHLSRTKTIKAYQCRTNGIGFSRYFWVPGRNAKDAVVDADQKLKNWLNGSDPQSPVTPSSIDMLKSPYAVECNQVNGASLARAVGNRVFLENEDSACEVLVVAPLPSKRDYPAIQSVALLTGAKSSSFTKYAANQEFNNVTQSLPISSSSIKRPLENAFQFEVHGLDISKFGFSKLNVRWKGLGTATPDHDYREVLLSKVIVDDSKEVAVAGVFVSSSCLIK